MTEGLQPGRWEWKILRKGTRRPYRMVERRWVLEYAATKCRGALRVFVHKRLGRVPKEVRLANPNLPPSALRVYLPYADLVCVWPDRIEIIEFKVHDPFKAISQLEYYRLLAENDPDLEPFKPRPITLKLVYWRHVPELEALCKSKGIVYEVELPQWLIPILRYYGYVV